MDVRTLAIIAAASLALAGCERSEAPQPAPAPADTAPADAPVPPPAAKTASFVNRVWAVAESKQVEPGALRVFLSDGTLVMASPNSTPAFGQWRSEDGRLTITEEGRDYPTDILALSEHAFRVRINGPGEPVEILFEPAAQVAPDEVASAAPAAAPQSTAAAATAAPAAPVAVTLLGTAWRLESLGNGKLQAGTQPTLEFPTEGRASGNGSCNRFNGIVIVADDGIKFSGLATTRKACPEAVMRQEEDYLAALRDAVRFEADAEPASSPFRGPCGAVALRVRAGARCRARAGHSPRACGGDVFAPRHLDRRGAPQPGRQRDERRAGEIALRREPATDCELRHRARVAVQRSGLCPEPRGPGRFPGGAVQARARQPQAAGGKSQMQVLQVQCDGRPWAALGGSLIELDRNRALAPWDGVFFELARDRDFRAIGQEPGWQLEIRMGSEMRLTYDYGKGSAVTPAARAELDAKTGTRTFHATAEANDLRVEVVPVRCEDTMSGKPFPATVTVTLNDRSFRGCGESLATPFQ